MRTYMSVFNTAGELLCYRETQLRHHHEYRLVVYDLVVTAKWKFSITPQEEELIDGGDLPTIYKFLRLADTVGNRNDRRNIRGFRLLWWQSRFYPVLVTNFQQNEIFHDKFFKVHPLLYDVNQPLIYWCTRSTEGHEVRPFTGEWHEDAIR